MISLSDFSRLIAPIRNKIMLIIGRCIVTAIDDSKGTQLIQGKGFSGEVISDIEKLEPYGFTSYPDLSSDVEAIVVYPNGNRDQGIAIVVGDRSKRPKGANKGDVTIYDKNSNKIELSVTGIKITTGDASSWKPNVLPVDAFTGLQHGGITAGIAKLTGG